VLAGRSETRRELGVVEHALAAPRRARAGPPERAARSPRPRRARAGRAHPSPRAACPRRALPAPRAAGPPSATASRRRLPRPSAPGRRAAARGSGRGRRRRSLPQARSSSCRSTPWPAIARTASGTSAIAWIASAWFFCSTSRPTAITSRVSGPTPSSARSAGGGAGETAFGTIATGVRPVLLERCLDPGPQATAARPESRTRRTDAGQSSSGPPWRLTRPGGFRPRRVDEAGVNAIVRVVGVDDVRPNLGDAHGARPAAADGIRDRRRSHDRDRQRVRVELSGHRSRDAATKTSCPASRAPL
jgi:hypothetical protein